MPIRSKLQRSMFFVENFKGETRKTLKLINFHERSVRSTQFPIKISIQKYFCEIKPIQWILKYEIYSTPYRNIKCDSIYTPTRHNLHWFFEDRFRERNFVANLITLKRARKCLIENCQHVRFQCTYTTNTHKISECWSWHRCLFVLNVFGGN